MDPNASQVVAPIGPVDRAPSSLSSLCLIARLHHIAAEPEHLAHRLGWTASHTPDADDLLLAARLESPRY